MEAAEQASTGLNEVLVEDIVEPEELDSYDQFELDYTEESEEE